ncbi:AVAST type 1 anti-phage system MBL fold metallo-hydrolase Avs1a [Priestia aryabhattai]
MSEVKVEMYPALEGDSFLVSIGDEKKTHILIDGGFKETFNVFLKFRLKKMFQNGEQLSLVVVTHIDTDHIEGIIELFKENKSDKHPLIIPINEVWHNSYKHLCTSEHPQEKLTSDERAILSDIVNQGYANQNKTRDNQSKDISAKDGSTLAALLYGGEYKWNSSFNGQAINCEIKDLISLTEDINIRILSPDSQSIEKLRKYWFKELKKKKYDFKLSDDEIFDDAYEFFMLNQSVYEQLDENKEISSKNEGVNIDALLKRKMNYDNSPVNSSSISFIIEYKEKKLLFLADSNPRIIEKQIQKLVNQLEYTPFFDLIKISHHGSHRNTSPELLDLIDSSLYLFSTNGKKNNHPNLETIARIISRKGPRRRLIFNYPVVNALISNEDLKSEYNFSVELSSENRIKVIDL